MKWILFCLITHNVDQGNHPHPDLHGDGLRVVPGGPDETVVSSTVYKMIIEPLGVIGLARSRGKLYE